MAERSDEKEGFWSNWGGGGGQGCFNSALNGLLMSVPSVTQPDLHDTGGFCNSLR